MEMNIYVVEQRLLEQQRQLEARARRAWQWNAASEPSVSWPRFERWSQAVRVTESECCPVTAAACC